MGKETETTQRWITIVDALGWSYTIKPHTNISSGPAE